MKKIIFFICFVFLLYSSAAFAYDSQAEKEITHDVFSIVYEFTPISENNISDVVIEVGKYFLRLEEIGEIKYFIFKTKRQGSLVWFRIDYTTKDDKTYAILVSN